MTHLWWGVPGSVVVSSVLFAAWYLVFGSASIRTKGKRVGAIALTIILFLGLASRIVRYTGSSSGSSFPKLEWAWERDTSETLSIPHAKPSDLPKDFPTDIESLELDDFLGPERDGMWTKASFGTDWTTSPPVRLWRRSIGKAWSSFTVSGHRVFTQQQVGDEEQVICLDLRTGEEIWHHSDPNTRLLLERSENDGAAMGGDGPRATPTVYEGRVYTMGSTGIVNCLDKRTGKQIWSRHLLRDLGASLHRWGMASSPLILAEEKQVILAGGDEVGPTLVSCDLDTGETRWITKGSGASYSSARLVTLCGQRQVLSVNRHDVSGVDPATGAVLWSHPWPGLFPKSAQPLVVEYDRVLMTASYGAGSLLIQISRTQDGLFSTKELWKTNQMKTKFSSAVILGDHAYGLDEGRLACISLETGKKVWKNEKFGFGQQLLFGQSLLVQTESGDVVVGAIGIDGFIETGRIAALHSMTWNVPVVVGRILLTRNDQEATAWLLPSPIHQP